MHLIAAHQKEEGHKKRQDLYTTLAGTNVATFGIKITLDPFHHMSLYWLLQSQVLRRVEM